MTYYVSSQDSEETRDESSDIAEEVHKSLLVEERLFSACFQQTQTWKQRKEFKEKKVEDCAWTPVVDETLLKFLESVEHKSGWYPFENGHAQVAYRAKALRTPDSHYDRKKFHLRTCIVKRKGVWWLIEMNHDMNKENVSTSLEEEAEVLVSVFLPSERAYLATTPQLTPEIVEELLEHRNRPVPPPSKACPSWLAALREGDHDRFDRILEASKCTKLAARWLQFLLLLGVGDIERNPGPGFVRRPRVPRGELSMTVGFAEATTKRMQSCLDSFAVWLASGLSLDAIGWDFVAGPLALRAYGMYLFSDSFPRYMYVCTITAMQDTYPHLRPFFSSAWQIDRKWQQFEPGHCRPVLSAPIFRAITSLCLLWKWYRWLGITLIGFLGLGMLHPAEFIHLVRADILLPEDTLSDSPCCSMCTFGIPRQRDLPESNIVRLMTLQYLPTSLLFLAICSLQLLCFWAVLLLTEDDGIWCWTSWV